MSALEIVWLAATAPPSLLSEPAVGSVAIVTPASASPASTSAKPNSSAEKMWAVSSAVTTVLAAAVGTSFLAATSTVMV